MTDIVVNRSSARRFAAVSALVAAPLAYLNIAIYLIVSGGDMSLLFDSARALALSPALIDLFRLGMVLDSFGFYLLYLPIGGYLWATLRRDDGSVVDAAVLFLVAYVILGVLGASIQIVALPLLAELHKSADPAIRSGSEMAWLLVVNIAQRAVWWMEGPTFALWAIPTGLVMRAQALPFGRTLSGVGVLYALFFILTFLRVDNVAELIQLVAILILPLWLILLGVKLWPNRAR